VLFVTDYSLNVLNSSDTLKFVVRMSRAAWVLVCGLVGGGAVAHADEAPAADPPAVAAIEDEDDPKAARAKRTADAQQAESAPATTEEQPTAEQPETGEAQTTEDNGTNVLPGGDGDANNTVVMAAPEKPRHRHWGLGFNVGAPDIMVIEAIVRPKDWLRLHAGIGTDLVNVGLMGGVTLVPLKGKWSPSLTVEGGGMFQGNGSWLASAFHVAASEAGPFKKIGYDYCNLHAGIELGSPERFQFYIHGGMSYVALSLHDLSANGVTVSDTNVGVWMPSGKIGFVLYL
jgi:hypothetical protein